MGKTKQNERKPLAPVFNGVRPPTVIQVEDFQDEEEDETFLDRMNEVLKWFQRQYTLLNSWWYSVSDRNRIIIYVVSATIVLLSILAIALPHRGNKSSTATENYPPPMSAPTPASGNDGPVVADDPSNREAHILVKLSAISSPDALQDTMTPQNTAFQWIVNQDPLQLSSNAPNLQQRYALAVFFYSLEGPKWNLNNPWITTPDNGDDDFTIQLGSGVGQPECMWEGVQCDSNNNVMHIFLEDKGLAGEFPTTELLQFTQLVKMDLRNNLLKGSIPNEFGQLVNLSKWKSSESLCCSCSPFCLTCLCAHRLVTDVLLLTGNMELNGSIVHEICQHVEFVTVECDLVKCPCCDNCEGDFDESSVLSDDNGESSPSPVKGRVAEINQLLGEVSPDLGQAGSPQNLALNWILYGDGRKVEAADDTIFQRYVVAVFFYALGGEEWSFTSSAWLSEESECTYPGIACNEFGFISTIAMVDSGLKGVLPPELGLLDDLEFLDLADNEINGVIPVQLSELDNLESILLQDNNLSGSVPGLVCQLREGDLLEFKTDCGGPNPSVKCGCCTNCEPSDVAPKLDYMALFGRRGDQVAQILSTVSSDIYIQDSTRFDATEWILKEDPMALEHDDDGLIQRWIMALLYFQFGGANWIYTNYLNGDSECTWDQVVCNNAGEVVEIRLSKCLCPQYFRHFFDRISLTFLIVTVASGGLFGLVPFEIGALEKLEVLDLHGNFIEGEAPDEFCMNLEDADASLEMLIFDCLEPPLVECDCCTPCSGGENTGLEGPQTGGSLGQLDYLALFGRRGQHIAQELESLSPEIYVEGSSRASAAQWLIKEDGMNLEHSDPLLLQRFVLSLLYFQWDGPNWSSSDNYLTNQDECLWEGIECNDDNQVTGIVLGKLVAFFFGLLSTMVGIFVCSIETNCLPFSNLIHFLFTQLIKD